MTCYPGARIWGKKGCCGVEADVDGDGVCTEVQMGDLKARSF